MGAEPTAPIRLPLLGGGGYSTTYHSVVDLAQVRATILTLAVARAVREGDLALAASLVGARNEAVAMCDSLGVVPTKVPTAP